MSDNGIPDLGGLNNEETFFADEVCQMIFPFCLLVCVGFVMNFARFHVFLDYQGDNWDASFVTGATDKFGISWSV